MSKTKKQLARYFSSTIVMALALVSSGCTSVMTPMTGTPVTQLPKELLGASRSDLVPVPVVLLARKRPEEYVIQQGDILAVYIRGILPYSDPAAVPPAPPVNFNTSTSELPPSIGFPIPVQDLGVINLPLLPPIEVAGLTLEQIREKVLAAYLEREIIRPTDEVPIISIMKERRNDILVLRSETNMSSTSTGVSARSDQSSAAYTLDLPFYKSDVLNALTESGGLPGINEKNEVVVYRTSRISAENRQAIIAKLMSPASSCSPVMTGYDVATSTGITFDDCMACSDGMVEDSIVTRIPLRMPPGQIPELSSADIELEDGDIVMVESRETEMFYTGGLLGGGQYLIPRDYDLDVLGALAIAGQGLASQSAGGGMRSGLGGPSPSLLFIIRKMPCGRTFNIMVDLQQAMNDSTQNILVQPGDTLILRYKAHEELTNFSIGTFFTYGIRQLFQNN
ncbi:polysaccharide biosynthesis/export family protein [Rhodopirellula sp. MGV]|uniref:polysaccharide biosynthesis/export family protein n=1 Tax=Rhodopirellula sp. MGV TaxID=2023130 RepID=UPI001E52CADC|nr:polysaccharide biosynthesis/export family protein [Rhodopirellula sp. MGV]